MKRGLLCGLAPVLEDFLPPDLRKRLEALLPGLRIIGPEAAWRQDPGFFSAQSAQVLITGWGAPQLPDDRAALGPVEYVCHLGGTVRGLVPRRLIKQGLLVTNWGTCHAATVAECALMLAMVCLRRVVVSQRIFHLERGWVWSNDVRPGSLIRRRVGLHGFGSVARALLPLLRPFDVDIRVYSAGVPDDVLRAAGVEPVDSLDALFAHAEVLFEIEAKSPVNEGSVGSSHFARLPDGAVFVNVGRAGIVQEAALLEVARSGRIGLGLDVYHQEPLPPDSPLRGLDHVCLLGHQAGPTPERRRDAGEFALANLEAFLRGEEPVGRVTLEAYDRAT